MATSQQKVTLRVTAECGSTIARFTVAYLDPIALQAFKVCDGATLRDLAHFGVERADVDSLRITESRDFTVPVPTYSAAFVLLRGAMPDAAAVRLGLAS